MILYRQFATQEEIDKEYDVENSAPDFQRHAEFNINESKKARDELECLLDVPFGPTVKETFDIFPARLPDRAPPLFVSVGGAESSELRRQSADYLHAWKAAGVRGWSFEQPEANHFMAIAGFIDKESKLCVNLKQIVETSEAG